MLGKNILHKSVTFFTLAAVWTVFSMVALAVPADMAGEISVTGQVTVNGQAAVSNSTILSGAVVSTGDASSAVVSLGKIGRVELQANSSMTLNFSQNSITAILSAGKARVSNSAGVATSVATKHASVIADAGQADNFLVEVECSHTHVDTTAGIVTMREGANDKQVAAGSSASVGNMNQATCPPCMRPGSDPGPAIAGYPWLILLAAGAAAAGIYLTTRGGDTNVGGTAIIVSPTR